MHARSKAIFRGKKKKRTLPVENGGPARLLSVAHGLGKTKPQEVTTTRKLTGISFRRDLLANAQLFGRFFFSFG